MKLLKTLAMGAILATVAGHASAQTTIIHVTGSTAFRTGTAAAIIDYLAGATATNYVKTTPVFAAFINPGVNAPNLLGANQQVFANGYISTAGATTAPNLNPNYTGNTTAPAPAATTIVVTSWTGSAAGLVDITTQESFAQFLDVTQSAVQVAVNNSQVNTASGEFYNAAFQGNDTPDAGGAADAPTSSNLTTTQQTSIDLSMCDTNKGAVQAALSQGTVTYTQIPNTSFATYPQLTAALSGLLDAGTTGTTTTPTGALTVPLAGTLGHVAVCPFQWVVGNMTNSTGTTTSYIDGSTFTIPTDMTSEAAIALITNGHVTQGILTNDTGTLVTKADAYNQFYLTGRNEDSGSRVTAFAESGYNVGSTNPKQFAITAANGISLWGSGGSQPNFTALNTFSHNGTNYIIWNRAGHSGYNSGGNVASALDVKNPGNLTVSGGATLPTGISAVNSFVIGYVGLTDAANAIAGVSGAAPAFPQASTAIPNGGMTYNGVPFTEGYVQSGQYPLWSYEHAYKTANSAAGVDTIADLIATKDADVFYVVPSKPNDVSDTYSFPLPTGVTAGINHAETSSGSYNHYQLTLNDNGSATSTVQPFLAVGLFDDSAMNVTRTDTTYAGLITHK